MNEILICYFNTTLNCYSSIDYLEDDNYTPPYLAIEFDCLLNKHRKYDVIALNYQTSDEKRNRFFGEIKGITVTFRDQIKFDMPSNFKNSFINKIMTAQINLLDAVFENNRIKKLLFNIDVTENKNKKRILSIIFFPLSIIKSYYRILLRIYVLKSKCLLYKSQNDDKDNEQLFISQMVIFNYSESAINALNLLFKKRGITIINRDNGNRISETLRFSIPS